MTCAMLPFFISEASYYCRWVYCLNALQRVVDPFRIKNLLFGDEYLCNRPGLKAVSLTLLLNPLK